MQKRFTKGFTLIELLVVIAIIGILAAIALTSLGSARNKAKDSSATGSLSSARAAAEIYFDTNNGYTGLCADTEIVRLTTAATAQSGTATCGASATAHYISIDLLDATNDFCVDSTGYAGKQLVAVGPDTVNNDCTL